MKDKKLERNISFIVNILAVIFVLFLILITVFFVSARNNHGMITVLSVGYFSDGDSLYTVMFTDDYKVTEESIGKAVAYSDENNGMAVSYGVIEAQAEVKEYELPKVKMTDGSVVKVKNIIGTISGRSSAWFFNLATTGTGYILSMVIPGVCFIGYYAVTLLLSSKKSKSDKKQDDFKESF